MRERSLLEQNIEDALEQGKEENLTRYLFEILLDIRQHYVPTNQE